MPTMSDDELRCMRFLAERFDRGGRSLHVRIPELPGYAERGEHGTKEMLLRFSTHGFVRWQSTGSVIVRREAWEFVHGMADPAPVNHVEEWKAKWLGRKWFALMVVAFLVLGTIATVIANIRSVLSYFGIYVEVP